MIGVIVRERGVVDGDGAGMDRGRTAPPSKEAELPVKVQLLIVAPPPLITAIPPPEIVPGLR